MGGAGDVDEGVPPPWIRMVKKSSFANLEDDGIAPPWVRMVRKRQEIHPDKFGRLRLLKLQDESMMLMPENSERVRRAESHQRSYRPGLWVFSRAGNLFKFCCRASTEYQVAVLD